MTYHWTNMAKTLQIQHIEPTCFMDIQTPCLAHLSQITITCYIYFTCYCYVWGRSKLPTKLDIQAIHTKYFIDIRQMYIHICTMKSLVSTIQQGTLCTYLTCSTEQIWLPNHIYVLLNCYYTAYIYRLSH